MGRKNHRIGNAGWKDQFYINPEEFGVTNSKKQIEIEPTPVERKDNKKQAFVDSIKVDTIPTAKKKVTNAGEYPENAVIISMGLPKSGRTNLLTNLFKQKEIYSFIKTEREDYIKNVQQAILEKSDEKVVIDAPFLDMKFRKAIYRATKEAEKTVFIMNYKVTYQECLKKIQKMNNPNAVRINENNLVKAYLKFKEVQDGLEDELAKYEMINNEYESQVVDIINIHNEVSTGEKENSVEVDENYK